MVERIAYIKRYRSSYYHERTCRHTNDIGETHQPRSEEISFANNTPEQMTSGSARPRVRRWHSSNSTVAETMHDQWNANIATIRPVTLALTPMLDVFTMHACDTSIPNIRRAKRSDTFAAPSTGSTASTP